MYLCINILFSYYFFQWAALVMASDIDRNVSSVGVKSFYQHQEDYEDSVFQYRPLSHSFVSTSSVEADTPSLQDHQESSFLFMILFLKVWFLFLQNDLLAVLMKIVI